MFPRTLLPGGAMPEGGARTWQLNTRSFLSHSAAAGAPPGVSEQRLVVSAQKEVQGRRSRSRRKSSRQPPTVLAVLKKVQLEHHYPLLVAQEVDLPALMELQDQVGPCCRPS